MSANIPKRYDFVSALNRLGVGAKDAKDKISIERIPKFARVNDFLGYFLPYLIVVGDSREQNKWIADACAYYGIQFEWHTKGDSGNLKEGDYTFMVRYPNCAYNYEGIVAYERKGSLSELYHNCTGYDVTTKTNDRERIEREFDRFIEHGYEKVVMLLEYGESLNDLIDAEFTYRPRSGVEVTKNVGNTIFATLMSWKQPNFRNFDILQSNSHGKLFWLMLFDCFYYFRNQVRKEYYATLKGVNDNGNS